MWRIFLSWQMIFVYLKWICIFCHVRIYSINDRPSWLIDWQFVKSSVYCSLSSCLLLQLLKRLLLKYSVNVMALSISCFILVRLPHACWSYRIVCQCLGFLSVYGSNSSVTIYNNIPVLRVRALRYVWTGSQNGSAWSFCFLFLILFQWICRYGFYLRTVVLKPLRLITSLDV